MAKLEKFSSESDRQICNCFNITVSDIKEYMVDGSRTIDDLVRDTAIGTKCTACFLDVDLVLGDLQKNHGSIASQALSKSKQNWMKSSGIEFAQLRKESGFFINQNGIQTTLVCGNDGFLFEKGDTVVPFSYRIYIYDNDGQIRASKKGVLQAHQTLTLDFCDVPKCPPQGWFILNLLASKRGLEGATRPQFFIHADGFSASVHTQPVSSACKSKISMLKRHKNGCRVMVQAMNATSSDAEVTLNLTSIDGEKIASNSSYLSRKGSFIWELESIFPDLVYEDWMLIEVKSDKPIRKHIIHLLNDGSWSLDHFQNAK